jgi:crossover junction endodeoxyribonuclease RuvC
MAKDANEPGVVRRLRVLGVDPGTRVVGYGILDVAPGIAPALVVHGALRLPARSLAARLELLFREMRDLIAAHAPGVLAIEQVFRGKNFESVRKMGEARGVIVLAAQMAGLDIREYAPALIKKAATGNGNAAKVQVEGMMCRLLGVTTARADAADALAAAFCHGQRLARSRLGLDPAASFPRARRDAALPGPGPASSPAALAAAPARLAARKGSARQGLETVSARTLEQLFPGARGRVLRGASYRGRRARHGGQR